jgi:mannose-6-phosphate isomerase-like protein (cupin superfamily)
MTHAVVRGADLTFRTVAEGFACADMVAAATGSVHLEQAQARLAPGAATPAVMGSFEESWYVLDGGGTVSVAELTYEVAAGSYGVVPVGVPHQLRAGGDGMRWLRTRAPQPRTPELAAGHPVPEWHPASTARTPSEIDPRSRWAGVFTDSDMGPYGPLSMPGYHGPNIQSIFVRMLVDELLGARHHTLFMVEFGAQAVRGRAATEHYHPFEETYFLIAGSATGTLDGEVVEVAAGDLVWTSVNGTHAFVNSGDVPVRWLEVQAPVPPASDAFFFPKDWDALR